ncbi:DUF2332 domain-containing protein [Paracoccus sulfuroxidans]|uniref:DUF2332 family protein n=1 Tax=Paracoccus sulfuroxidans TaxID=384678 RepID=A0A562P0Q1_9RHOB|nr:DUF2332 domain-containing protein [Paracoccus sulfuroxidans]TWI38072.1 hypothetical protein IQ24_00206 [Paracoccus sulfuroxidans]
MSSWALAFTTQAEACRALDSALTAEICEALLAHISVGEDSVSRRVRDWPGDLSYRGDSVPLRLCGALHALVLEGKDPALAQAYAGPPTGDLQEVINNTLQYHTDYILDFIDLPPQTNEVGRSGAIIAAAWHLTALFPAASFKALELGASAGLNLNFYRYHLVANNNNETAPDTVLLTPDWRGAVPARHSLRIDEAAGVDINPLDPLRDALRMKAYIWPDQPQRLARMDAALSIARAHPPKVDKADAAEWLEAQLDQPSQTGRLVYHTIAAQYFPPRTRERIEAALQRAGETASDHAPLAHFSMESSPTTGADLLLRVWSKGRLREWHLGQADAHARWIDWQPEEI